ncbi:unnamed protein product, partial [Rotaria sp. Silwood1]
MWGANVAATFEQILNDSKTAEEIQGELFANFSKATLNISGHAKLENIAQINSQNCALKISFSGDVLIEDIPRTPDDVFRIFQKVPLMLRELNNGKGQQLEFELYPLKRIASNFKRELQIQRIIKDIDIHVMNRIEDTFEQIIKGKRILNDFLDKIEPWRDWLPPHWLQVVDNKRLELAGKQLEIQRRLASLLEKIRRGEAEQNEMIVLLDEFDEKNPCSVLLIKKFLKENSRIEIKIDSLGEFDDSIKEKQPNADLLLKRLESISDIVDQYYVLANNSYLCVAFLPLMPTPLRSCSININPNATWIEHGLTVAGGSQYGNQMNK